MSDRAALKGVLQIILANQEDKALNWAVGYTIHALKMLEAGDTDENLYTQLLYLRGNLSSWRGSKAKEVRSIVDSFIRRLAPTRTKRR